MSLLDLLRSVPAVIWSGVIGAGLAFGGVLIAGRNQRLMQRSQLQHDAAEKARERTAVLRREVYLKAAEELVKATVYLGGLAQAEPNRINIGEGLQGFVAAVTKLQLVAEMPTTLLVSDLAAQYDALVLRLTSRLLPLQQARADVELFDRFHKQAQEEMTRVLSEMSKVSAAGASAPEAAAALHRALDAQQAFAHRHARDRDHAAVRVNRLSLAFVRQLFVELRQVGQLYPKLMVELRRDLALTSDLDQYELQLEQQWEGKAAQIDEMLGSLEVLIEQFSSSLGSQAAPDDGRASS